MGRRWPVEPPAGLLTALGVGAVIWLAFEYKVPCEGNLRSQFYFPALAVAAGGLGFLFASQEGSITFGLVLSQLVLIPMHVFSDDDECWWAVLMFLLVAYGLALLFLALGGRWLRILVMRRRGRP